MLVTLLQGWLVVHLSRTASTYADVLYLRMLHAYLHWQSENKSYEYDCVRYYHVMVCAKVIIKSYNLLLELFSGDVSFIPIK